MRHERDDDRGDKAGRRRAARHSWKQKARSHAAVKGLPPKEAEKQSLTARLPGLISEVHRLGCVVLTADGPIESQWTHNILSEHIESPVVGDRVTVGLREGAPGLLTDIEARRTLLARMRSEAPGKAERARSYAMSEAPRAKPHVLAANIDTAVIVASARSPAFSPRLIDRYLVLCQFGGVEPVICLNKCDLADELPDLSIYSRMGVPVIQASVVNGRGVDELRARLAGKCSVLTGHSGVGKSSIFNAILGEEQLAVGDVSAGNQRGRHTTSASCLIEIAPGTYLIDTPGIRSLAVWQIEKDALGLYFPEFDEIASDCKFTDCRHATEPACAVRAAAEAGEIPPERYESYLRMLTE